MNYTKKVIMRFVGLFLSRLCYSYYLMRWKAPAKPGKVIWVAPADIVKSIEFTPIVSQRRYYLNGIIAKGEWGFTNYTVHELHQKLFDSFEKIFVEGVPFTQTSYFDKKKKTIKEEELIEIHNNEHKKAYRSIEKSGFHIPRSIFDEIDMFQISIGGEGDILFMTGKHRLAIALLMGEDFKIPANVSHRHIEWQKKRDLILKGKKSKERDILLEKYGDHPDIVSELEFS